MSAKHTPGPWEARLTADEFGDLVAVVAGVSVILEGELGIGIDAEDAANARLIAAAPELLEAALEAAKELTSLLGPVAGGDIPLRNLLAAISKARGEA